MTQLPDFTPALGRPELTGQYDRVIAIMTRERRWRARLLTALAPQPGETIIDLGAGTGSMAVMVKRAEPRCTVIGIDPDPQVLEIARHKLHKAGLTVDLVKASGEAELLASESADKVFSSLVLHQCRDDVKAGLLKNAYRLLRPRGRILVADYGLQRSPLMSLLFNQVRSLDGYENTRANKDGKIPELIRAAGFGSVSEVSVTATPTGSISIYEGVKAT